MSILRSNRPLRRLLGAWAQSCVGTGAGYVALLLLTYRDLHTSWAIAVVLLAEFLPAIALASWFGSCADRYSKRRLIIGANLVQAAAYGGLVFSTTALSIIPLALLAGVGNSLQRPALRSALPVVAGDAQQLAAALFDGCRWAGLTTGPLVAAVLFAFGGTSIPFVVNALSFVVAAAVMATLTLDGATRPGHGASSPPPGLRAGLAVALAAPGIGPVIACAAGTVVAGGLLNVCEPILATRVLHGSGSDFALLVACYGVGTVAATALVAGRGDMADVVLIRRFVGAIALIAAGMAGSSVVNSVPAAVIPFIGTGYGNALALVSAMQLVALRVPRAVQGRLFGAKDTVDGACFLVGLVGAGALVAATGARTTLATGATICAACAIAGIVLLIRPAREQGATTSSDGAPVDAVAVAGHDATLGALPLEVAQALSDDARRSA